jgi:hypothetical protein
MTWPVPGSKPPPDPARREQWARVVAAMRVGGPITPGDEDIARQLLKAYTARIGWKWNILTCVSAAWSVSVALLGHGPGRWVWLILLVLIAPLEIRRRLNGSRMRRRYMAELGS